MAHIVWTNEAENCLENIFDYITKELNNEIAAQRTVKGIYDKIQILEAHPEIGYPYEEASRDDVQVLLYGHYKIPYVYRNRLNDVVILGIYHGLMKMEDHIKYNEL